LATLLLFFGGLLNEYSPPPPQKQVVETSPVASVCDGWGKGKRFLKVG
jgi:hypothetical protein